jgi:hypothetical protein
MDLITLRLCHGAPAARDARCSRWLAMEFLLLKRQAHSFSAVAIAVRESKRSQPQKALVSGLDLIVQRSSDQLPQAEHTVLHVFCGRPTRVQTDVRA